MTLDLESIPADERKRLVEIGKNYSSRDTIKQAEQSLNAFENHKNALAEEGFTQEEADELIEFRQLLIEAGGDRDDARGAKKVTRQDLLDGIQDTKKKRLRARSALSTIRSKFAKLSTNEAKSARQSIDTVLAETSSSGADAAKLAAQCDRLSTVLQLKEVASQISARKLDGIAAELTSCAENLRNAAKATSTSSGTPVEQERLDLLDGLIIELTREARKAARAASSNTGNAAIAKEFELNKLYKPYNPTTTPSQTETSKA
jgi:hypothetical protein